MAEMKAPKKSCSIVFIFLKGTAEYLLKAGRYRLTEQHLSEK